jgi:hypothetical protein
LISLRYIAFSVFGAVLSVSPAHSQDLSRYRDFQLGAKLTAVAKQAQVKPSEAKAIHQRPALIQELEWKAPFTDTARRAESVGNILFSFYNGELYRLVVTYNRERIEGMTAEDLVDAISAKYGTADRSAADITVSSTHLFSDGEKLITDRSEKIVARWEDAQYSFNLCQSSSDTTFDLIVYSKRLDGLARAAIVESVRLDTQEAPQRESDTKKKKEEENRTQQEKARRVNKPPFRP